MACPAPASLCSSATKPILASATGRVNMTVRPARPWVCWSGAGLRTLVLEIRGRARRLPQAGGPAHQEMALAGVVLLRRSGLKLFLACRTRNVVFLLLCLYTVQQVRQQKIPVNGHTSCSRSLTEYRGCVGDIPLRQSDQAGVLQRPT